MARKRLAEARSSDYALLGRNLAEARNSMNLSQLEAAKRIGISQGTYSGYETGTRRIKLPMLRKIADVYGVTVDWLIGTEVFVSSDHSPIVLSDTEYKLISRFRTLNDSEKAIVLRSVGIE